MGKKRVAIILLMILCLLLVSSPEIGVVKAAEHVIFEDDFESYAVGSFPSSNWDLWFNGAGNQYQIIDDSVSDSPFKSFQLRGGSNWGSSAVWSIDTNLPKIGFSISVRVEEIGIGTGDRDNARVAFGKRLDGLRAHHWARILFQDNGTIASGGKTLQSYVADRWYKVTSIIDRTNETFSVWIDGILQAENLIVTTNHGSVINYPTFEIEAFTVGQFYNGVKVYFDDVKVFSVFDLNPKLDLQPTSGIAQTTLVGSGFTPNSMITVSWNGTNVYTIPNPLRTNGDGNFTAIMTVLNQTTLGLYDITVVDEMGNDATASFKVIPEFSSWIILPLFIVATLIGILVRRRVMRTRTSAS